MARMGLKADGIELNGPLVLYSILNSYRNGTHQNVKFYKKNIFKVDMKKYNTTVMFGAEQMVTLLTPKLNEMKQESHLILCRFPLDENEPNWKLVGSEGEGIDAAWVYKKITPSIKS
ncbi:unnamed protein product [Bursaphelenchus xylophilus]|uniref:(pine wood nematode) hypothetical protein n=1 Tax=Bursaphelenchus xylophilus TaxID=6326 RepID=A0A1I7SUC4_BURXY|nr:unnamed protein product [Bursaphelenchus xylophilus]CAG9107301.1 unnamed protein product [Bursaphelenchus xylophilus]